MGTYNHVYVGPYIKVKTVEKDVTYTKKISAATGKEFKDPNVYFCPVSGEKLIEQTYTQPEKIYGQPHDVPARLNEDAFWTPEYTAYREGKVFLCNFRVDQLLSADDLFVFDMAGFSHEYHLERFNAKYAEYIAHWKSLYGDENVMVSYGIVHYAN